MGIVCEINLHKIADGIFLTGGQVSGTIMYRLDEDMDIKTITISLKGMGVMSYKKRSNEQSSVNGNQETYVDVDHFVYTNESDEPLAKGTYETPFCFTLPQNIPSTMRFFRHFGTSVRCQIKYYIRIKFEQSAMLSLNKHFKKEIIVVGGITPTLPTVPKEFSIQKTLTQLCISKKSIITIRATIQSCVVAAGGVILLNYEINNDTNLNINRVKSKLLEVFSFSSKTGMKRKAKRVVEDTKTKTGRINRGDTQTMEIRMEVPIKRHSLEHSSMVCRQYRVRIEAFTPFPHRNAVLDIPVQIGYVPMAVNFEGGPPVATPTKWEVLKERTILNEAFYSDDDEEF